MGPYSCQPAAKFLKYVSIEQPAHERKGITADILTAAGGTTIRVAGMKLHPIVCHPCAFEMAAHAQLSWPVINASLAGPRNKQRCSEGAPRPSATVPANGESCVGTVSSLEPEAPTSLSDFTSVHVDCQRMRRKGTLPATTFAEDCHASRHLLFSLSHDEAAPLSLQGCRNKRKFFSKITTMPVVPVVSRAEP